MSFHAKVAAASLVIILLFSGWYFSQLVARIGTTPVGEIGYAATLVAVAIGIVVAIVTTIVIISVRSARRGEPIVEASANDVALDARGVQASNYVLMFGLVVGIALAILQADAFWIANSLFAVAMVAAITRAASVIYGRLRP